MKKFVFLARFSLSTSMATVFYRNPPGEKEDVLRKWFKPNPYPSNHYLQANI